MVGKDFKLTGDAERMLEQQEHGERKCSNCINRVYSPYIFCQFAMGMQQMVEQNGQVSSKLGNVKTRLPMAPINADDLAQICTAFVAIKPLRGNPELTR